ncbi:hypothetical protein pVco7_gp106 [Vibrio phage pVco-7]|uniref:Uncharacterized protein n=1 Tax=Vibrio phage pVco-5 TaxID=1965485 RepID=A0A1W6JV35_9CAUD|nr:hypothetical protein KNT61_gp107 [Vibrio phage pVco-5]ARM71095.1 hypothetical protein pVco5_106 [Vibrio phage pVco-5]
MKITLTYEEAVAYVLASDDFSHFGDGTEVVIEGFESTTPVVEEKPEEKPQRRKRRTRKQIEAEKAAQEPVNSQEELDAIAQEVDAELEADSSNTSTDSEGESSSTEEHAPSVQRTEAEQQQLDMVDEVIAEADAAEAEEALTQPALVEQEVNEVIDADAPLFP